MPLKPDSVCPLITTQVCYCSMKAPIDSIQTNGHDCVPRKLYIQQQAAGSTWFKSLSLMIPDLN